MPEDLVLLKKGLNPLFLLLFGGHAGGCVMWSTMEGILTVPQCPQVLTFPHLGARAAECGLRESCSVLGGTRRSMGSSRELSLAVEAPLRLVCGKPNPPLCPLLVCF